ncbi:MAG: peptidoglycan-binding protein [Patescibacteria group bacterium]|nr:peptidoglycan-binding protein [Patescibacteria group bacterium]
MSNLFKSKFFLGTLVVAVMLVGAVASFATPAKADCPITHTLRVGSTYKDEVKCLQTIVGATADGAFGPMTKAAVMAWQSGHGLVADGVVGPLTRAALAGAPVSSGTFPAGCTSATGYSTTTGQPCNTGSTLPAGCTSTAGYSPTTGAKCDGSTTGPVSTGTGEGTLTLQSAPVALTTAVAQGDMKDSIMAFNLKATGSNVTVNRVNVSLASGSSALPWNYFTNLYLYQGSNLLATLPVNSSTLTQNTFGSNYTASFGGLSSVIQVGTPNSYIVKADIVGTIPGSPVTYTVGLNDTSTSQVIRGTDGLGLTQYVTSSATYNQSVTFSTTGNGGLQVVTDSNNPLGNNVVENTNQTATGVVALVFDIKNTSNNSASVQSVAATINNVASVSAYYLYNGGTLVQSVGNPGGTTLTFTNFSPFTVAANSTAVMTIKFDASINASGTVNVAVAGSQVSALLNNNLVTVTGSSTGNNMVLIGTSGVSISLVGSPVFTAVSSTQGVTGYTQATFTFQVSPVGMSLVDLSKVGAMTAVGTNVTNSGGLVCTTGNSCFANDTITYEAGTSPVTNYIVSPVLTNGITDGNSAQVTVTVHKVNTGTAGNVVFSITGLRFAKTGWTVGTAMTDLAASAGNSIGVIAGLSNATVTGYTNN